MVKVNKLSNWNEEEEVEESEEEESELEEEFEEIELEEEEEADPLLYPETPLEEALELPDKPELHILAGSTDSGKTNLLLNLLRHGAKQGRFHRIYFLCPTVMNQEVYKGIVSSKYIITEPKVEDVRRIMKEQDDNPRRRIAIVFDDVMSDMNMSNSKEMERLASIGRQKRISSFILVQHLNRISTVIKENAKTLFVTELSSNSLDTAFRLQRGIKKMPEFEHFLEVNRFDFRCFRFNLTAMFPTKHLVLKPELITKIRFSFK